MKVPVNTSSTPSTTPEKEKVIVTTEASVTLIPAPSEVNKFEFTLEDRKFGSKSKYIRTRFFEEGAPIKEIAKESGILYQMVRNIVVKEKDARDKANREKPVDQIILS